MQCSHGHKEDVVFLHSKCHPHTPTWCEFHSDGRLIVRCADCDKEVATFHLKEATDVPVTEVVQ